MNTLEFDSISLSYGLHTILSSVHMKCITGNIVGLLGRNGSGKSSLLQSVFGTLSTENKSIRLNQERLVNNYLSKKLIGYLPQCDLIPSFLTFSEALKLYNIDFSKLESSFPELGKILNKKSAEVSGGQRRLFEVLLILYSNHRFSLFDEPFTGVMPIHIEKLIRIFTEEKSKKGIILTDHSHRYIRAICDQLYVIANGQTYRIADDSQLIKYGYLNEL